MNSNWSELEKVQLILFRKLPSNYKHINGTPADTDSNYTRIQIRNRNVVIQQEEVQQFQLGTNSVQLRGGAEQFTYIELWKNLFQSLQLIPSYIL